MSVAQITVLPLSVRGSPNPTVRVTFHVSVDCPSARLGYVVAAPPPRRRTVSEIQKAVAAYYGLGQEELIAGGRRGGVARHRQIAMWIAKQITTRSLTDLGCRFGNRHHTTVLHAIRRIEQFRAADPKFHDDTERLIDLLGGRPK